MTKETPKVKIMGLNFSASKTVRKAKKEESGEFYKLKTTENEETVPLHKFTLPKGNILFERVQAVILFSFYNPSQIRIFTALQDEEGRWITASLWKPVEIHHPFA